MSAQLFHARPDEQPDIGPHGYRQAMHVRANQAPDPQALADEGVTRAYAQAIIENGLHRVTFTSRPDGNGTFGTLEMSAEDAVAYPVGSEVMFHFRKDKEIGFGKLVAVTPGLEPIAENIPAEETSPRI